jgi:glycosyltransferase involved in cell wall biosynthesis
MKKLAKRILFARAADAGNFNAQAKNVQHILRNWQSKEYEPSVAAFYSADDGLAANPNVRVLHIRPDRLWPARWFATYMGRFDAIFCPGLHDVADWAALRTRAFLGRRPSIIGTFEGLLGEVGCDDRERRFSAVAGHKVYAQRVSRGLVRRLEAMDEIADHIIAISPFLARQAAARYGPKVSTLGLGVDLSQFPRREWINRARPRVVGAGNVRAHKRPELFLKCAALFPEADFAWFGEGELRKSLQADADRAGLINVFFPGSLSPEKLAQQLAASDIFILPSLAEGVPKVTQEAAASGLAQIVFGFYEATTVIDGRNGFVVWSDDALLAKLRQLIDNAPLVERMGRAGIEMAKDWSWEVIAPRWEERIIDVLEREDFINAA